MTEGERKGGERKRREEKESHFRNQKMQLAIFSCFH